MPINVVPHGPSEEPDRKAELRAWLKEAIPKRAFIIQDVSQDHEGYGEVYEILDGALESLGLIGTKAARFEREEFLRVIRKLLARQKGLDLDQVKTLDQVKQEALPLQLEMTEEVYQVLLEQGIRFHGQMMVMGDDWLKLRPEENDRIRFVLDRMGQPEMIVVENDTVGKGQIILYPIEKGKLRPDKKRSIPEPLGSAEASVMYLPEEVTEERLAHFQAMVDGHYHSDTHQVRIGQPHKQGDGVTEMVGIYLTPEISGEEVYYNDLQPWDESIRFTDEEFELRLTQALNTLGISFRWE